MSKINIDIEEIRKGVNECDRDFGLRLKSRNEYLQPDEIYEQALEDVRDYLTKLICVLNGVNVSDFYSIDEETGKINGVLDNFSFTSNSKLNWKEPGKYKITDVRFKCRFLTLYLMELNEKLNKMSKRKFEESDDKICAYEHAYFYLKGFVQDADRLINVMINNNDHENIILKNILNNTYSCKKVNHKELNVCIYSSITELKEGIQSSKFSERFMSDDMIIYSLLRIAYMVSTNKTNFNKALPKFKYIEGASKDDDLIKLIATLGSSIIAEHKYSKRPILYRAFNSASPKIMTNYKEAVTDYYVNTGLRALSYVDFIFDDKVISNFIYDMCHHA